MLHAGDILRARPWATATGNAGRVAARLVLAMVAFGLAYGAAMGTFAGVGGDRLLQVLYSAIKVPILLGVTFAVALPSFFVINTLMGVGADFGRALRALLATQAGLTIILASFAPFTLLWYASSANYQAAILFNALMFGVASVVAQRLLRRYYRPLIEANPVHRGLLRWWLFLYAFVGIQLGYVLRPFIGDPNSPTSFLRADPWGNAYEHVARLAWDVLRRGGGG